MANPVEPGNTPHQWRPSRLTLGLGVGASVAVLLAAAGGSGGATLGLIGGLAVAAVLLAGRRRNHFRQAPLAPLSEAADQLVILAPKASDLVERRTAGVAAA